MAHIKNTKCSHSAQKTVCVSCRRLQRSRSSEYFNFRRNSRWRRKVKSEFTFSQDQKSANFQLSSLSRIFTARKPIALFLSNPQRQKLPFSSTWRRRHRCMSIDDDDDDDFHQIGEFIFTIFTLVLLHQTLAWKGIVQCNQMHFYSGWFTWLIRGWERANAQSENMFS